MGTIPIAPATATGVLTRFGIEATGSDHHVRTIGILKRDDSAEVDGHFSDSSPGDDGFDFSVRYCELPDDLAAAATFSSVEGSCEITGCEVPIPGLSSTTTFLLVGFRVWLDGDMDQDLQSLVVMPSSTGNTVLVAFNGPVTLNNGFDYELQFALVPSARLREVVATDEEPTHVDGLRFTDSLFGDADHRYLGGFSFARVGLNSNVHLKSVSVDLNSGTATFHDDDGGEIVRWRVKYHVLR